VRLRRLMYDVRMLVTRRQREELLNDEIAFHIEQQAAQNERLGMTRAEALRVARATFGAIPATKEDFRDVSGFSFLESVANDARFGARRLLARPVFSATVVATLALGIAASTTVFTVLNAVLLRPLPYDRPAELVTVWEHSRRSAQPGANHEDIAPANLFDWQRLNRSFVGFAWYNRSVATLGGGNEPEQVVTSGASASLFPLLGIRPVLGRFIREDETMPGAERVVVIDESLWRRRFAADPKILGRTVTLDAVGYRVIGVAPAGGGFPREAALWTPLILSASSWATRNAHYLDVIARLRPDASMSAAQIEMNAIAAQLERQYPTTNADLGVNLISLTDELVGSVRPSLWLVFGAVAFVLIIACANVAGLFLARAAANEGELALRRALGASRRRLVQQVLTESFLLSAVAGVLGILIAIWSTQSLARFSPVAIVPASGSLGLDLHVAAFALALALATTVVFGLAQATGVGESALQAHLKRGGQQALIGSVQQRGRRVLVAAELGFTMVLLAGAGLMVRGLAATARVDLGFRPTHLFTAEIRLPGARYSAGSGLSARFYARLVADAKQIPGVEAASAVFMLPFGRDNRVYSFRAASEPGTPQRANFRVAAPGYFGTMGSPMLSGRDISWTDSADGRRVVVINKTMAERFWPGRSALGQVIRIRNDTTPVEIVGVVADMKYFGHEAQPEPEMYVPHAQVQVNAMTVVVRTRDDPSRVAASFAATVRALDSEIALGRVSTMSDLIDASLAVRRFTRGMLSGFAAAALLLSGIGIYGLVAYSVTQRRREIGIRVAVGARPRDVLTLVTASELRISAIGIVVGAVVALMLSRALAASVPGLVMPDPIVLLTAGAVLAVAALVASAIPAIRAAHEDPVAALRTN
jgi:predicted permease